MISGAPTVTVRPSTISFRESLETLFNTFSKTLQFKYKPVPRYFVCSHEHCLLKGNCFVLEKNENLHGIALKAVILINQGTDSVTFIYKLI